MGSTRDARVTRNGRAGSGRRRTAATVGAFVLWSGLTPAANATPPLQGSIAIGTQLYGFCLDNPACSSFFLAGCPDAVARPDGVNISIAPVSSSLWDRTLTFTWSDVNATAYDALVPTTGDLTPRAASIYMHLVDSCERPSGLPQVTLGAEPSRRTAAVKIPRGTQWVIAWGLPGTADMEWWAQ